MKSIRIGNDINIAWSILEKGAPYNLEGLKTNLYLKDMYGKSPIACTVEGNVIFLTFKGVDQKHTGKYSLELVINEGENNMITTDARNFVNLVFKDCNSAETYDIDSLEPCNHDSEIEISSELGYVAMIVDTELSETSENAVSNKAVVAGLNSVTSDWDAAPNEKGYIKNKPFGDTIDKKFDADKFIFDSSLGSYYMPLSVLSGDDLYIKYRPEKDAEIQEKDIKHFNLLEDTASAILVNDISNGVYMYIGTRNEQPALFVQLYDSDTSYDNRNLLRSELDYYLRYCTKYEYDYTPVINTIPDYYVSGRIARTEKVQPKLVSGENIKTVNGESILGKGDLKISGIEENGYYKSVTVGYSDNLVGRGEATPEMFSFRASGGRSINDGTARIKTLHGNAVVWNQILPDDMEGQDAIVTKTEQGYIINPNGSYPGIRRYHVYPTIGHKYVILCTKTGGTKPLKINWGGYDGDIANGVITVSNENKNTITLYSLETETFTLSKPFLIDITKMFGAGNEPTSAEEFNARMPLNVDMTAYNEGEVIPFNATAIKSVGDNAWDGLREMGDISGTTGEEFDSSSVWRTADYIRILPNAEYCVEYTSSAFLRARFYDKHKNFIGIVSANNTDIYTNKTFTALNNAYFIRFAPNLSVIPYDSELCVRLVHSGWKQDTGAPFEPYKEFIRNIDNRILELFPNGMHKWDKAYNKNGKGYVVKGTGVKRMKDLSWSTPSGALLALGIVCARIADMKEQGTENETIYRKNGLLSSKYAHSVTANFSEWMDDKSMWRQGKDYGIVVRDSAYTSVEAFVASLKDEDVVYYELAEPQVYEFSEPFNLDYEVADFGTEEILSDTPSAPLSADIIYQFNAVDSIRDLLARIAVLESKVK